MFLYQVKEAENFVSEQQNLNALKAIMECEDPGCKGMTQAMRIVARELGAVVSDLFMYKIPSEAHRELFIGD